VIGRLVGRIRRHFREHGDDAERAALARVDDPPASAKHLEALAAAIDRHAGSDPKLGAELQGLVDEAGEANLDWAPLCRSGHLHRRIAGAGGRGRHGRRPRGLRPIGVGDGPWGTVVQEMAVRSWGPHQGD
jgi:hypothetical protein